MNGDSWGRRRCRRRGSCRRLDILAVAVPLDAIEIRWQALLAVTFRVITMEPPCSCVLIRQHSKSVV